MASLIPGFEYDIFISYRQKDNRGERWVSEFVEALKAELESTFKEEVSIYFDVNPHDGLLETHDVGDSLKEKLKCLIFIPVLSRTYCDPKSFAWENEFKAFIESASKDQFGLKVKLPNGNIANRVLPVRIHDLDEKDVKLCESTLGSVLRGIEFIYKSQGINRPLRSQEERANDNLNKTIYRDQINKIALAIKELIYGIKGDDIQPEKEEAKERSKSEKYSGTQTKKRKLFSVIGTIALLIAAVYILYPVLFRATDGKIIVSVMPFQNISKDTTLDVWQEGLQVGLISGLTGTEGVELRSRQSVMGNLRGKGITSFASLTTSIAGKAAQELGSSVFIHGSIVQAGSRVQVNAQLIDSGKETVLTSVQFEGPNDEAWIFKIKDSLALKIRDYILVSKLKREASEELPFPVSTDDPEAFKYYLYGINAFSKSDYPAAINWYTKAIEKDSNFVEPLGDIIWAHMNLGLYNEAKPLCLRFYRKKETMPLSEKSRAELTYLYLFGTLDERLMMLKQLVEVEKSYHLLLGNNYMEIGQYLAAVSEYEKSIENYAEMRIPLWILDFTLLGDAYHKAKLYDKEKKLYAKAEKEFPDAPQINRRQASLSLIEGDTAAANLYIKRYIKLRSEKLASESDIKGELTGIYNRGGNMDKAEAIFRHEVLPLDPDNPDLLNGFAYFLIDNNRDINEGLNLVGRALEIDPDNDQYLDTKGWGLYKQGKYEESLVFLEKGWKQLPVYDHTIFTHIQAVKKAIAEKK